METSAKQRQRRGRARSDWSLDIPNQLLREVVILFAIVAWPELRNKRFIA
jgi:hypothetical protein